MYVYILYALFFLMVRFTTKQYVSHRDIQVYIFRFHLDIDVYSCNAFKKAKCLIYFVNRIGQCTSTELCVTPNL